MMIWLHLCLILGFCAHTHGFPIDPKDAFIPAGSSELAVAIFGVAFLVALIAVFAACACCKERRDGFKEFRNSSTSLNHIGFTNSLASELAIFPPPGAEPRIAPQITPHHKSEPLSKPAAFASAVPDISSWFGDPNANFPRHQLFYQREIGKGWFGKVVEGEARGTRVMVRILREDATPEEQAFFLHEAKPFRDLRHRNVIKLFASCLDQQPYLLLFELQSNGDLKSFLVTNAGSKSAINEQGLGLRMMTDVAEGLNHMIENGYIHTDLAARNCLVTSDLTVKIGDYGTSIDLYKDEYYIIENVAVPIRWCAPETLHCTPTTIETKQVTAAASVWSLAVVLWEIAQFGILPYEDLTDDQVIIRVFGSEKYRLSEPDCPYGNYLHNILQLCWRTTDRATLPQVLSMLHYLRSNPIQQTDFDARWNVLKPNTIPVVDNHTPIHSPRHTELAQRPQLQTKLEFDSGVDLEIRTGDDSTPMTVSPQLSVTSEELFQSTAPKKSASLTNLQGSLEDVAQFEEETYARNVSEAIKSLDDTLALEKTSSSSQDSSFEGGKKPLMGEFKLGPLDPKGESSSSDTEDETWRNRVERGEFTEKVKEKSKSVTDLMVLTHIESEGSETDSLPSLTRQYSIKKNGSKMTTFTSIGFGSEGNIRKAVLSEELQDRLRQLSIWKTDEPSFLGKVASEVKKTTYSSKSNSASQDVPNIIVSESNVKDVYKEPETDVETGHLVNPPLRPFIFVCQEESAPVTSVILGSCEEHTLDFFKGLKTTFKPPETSSDEEDDKETFSDKENFSSQESLREANDHDIFTKKILPEEEVISQKRCYDSYYSIDSGHSSDRCSDQDQQMIDLKTRLEDVALSDDFQLKRSEEEYGGKLHTPDDERSSDSGFRDKGSLSESVEDTCDEKYNLEDIDAELDGFNIKGCDELEEKPQLDGWFLHPQTFKENGWHSVPAEDEEKPKRSLNDEFVAAIRNELREKLSFPSEEVQEPDEDSSPEGERSDIIAQPIFPAPLSPIIEEQESSHSSLVFDENSPVFRLEPPQSANENFKEDIIKALDYTPTPERDVVIIEDLDYGGEEIFPSETCTADDVLIIDTETNEATLIESPKPKAHVAFIMPRTINENFIFEEEDLLASDLSCDSNTISSPDNGVHSGFFLSPCSIRSDLFDSGPPSLPFDLGQSMEEVEDFSPSKEPPPTSPPSDKTFSLATEPNAEEIFESIVSTDSASTLEAESDTVLFKCGEPVRPTKIDIGDKNDSSVSSLTPSLSEQSGTFSERSAETYESRTCFNDYEPFFKDPEASEPDTERALTALDLIMSEPLKKEDAPVQEKEKASEDEWLKTLFNGPSVSVTDTEKWPTIDELIPDKSPTEVKPKLNITSTLALQSPDLSFSTDSSKSHSLLSSFASTPTCEEKPIQAKEEMRLSLPEQDTASAPLPSPEDADKGWRPTIGQLIELTDQVEGEEMSTSFIEPDENGTYTPDWESDTSEEQSSSSSEFIWKEGDREDEIKAVAASSELFSPQETKPMEKIEEEEEDREGSLESDDDSSDESAAEFIPSTWDSTATPTKSALKILPRGAAEKKRVMFKKEKYQCIYEYPREPSDDEDDDDSWNKPKYNYAMFEDWELGDGEFPCTADGDSDTEDGKSSKKHQDYDFYRLDYNIGSQYTCEDGDFYISGSSQGSEFFPGQGVFECDQMSEFLPTACDLTPVKLGELRHTKDQLRLELPSIRPDKGEASILDSGIDTSSA